MEGSTLGLVIVYFFEDVIDKVSCQLRIDVRGGYQRYQCKSV